MSTYYVSTTDGNDANSGISKALPFKTTAPINAKIAANTLFAGDIVKFKAGDVFPGAYLTGDRSWDTAGSVEISTYGEGSKPLFDMYKYILSASWVATSDANIWKLDLSDTTKYTGNKTNTLYNGANAGSIRVNGIFLGRKYATYAELLASTTQWDFACTNTNSSDSNANRQWLYVKSFANPGTLAAEIAVSVEGKACLNVKSNIDYYDLSIIGHGGVSGNFGSGAVKTTFNNIEVRQGGGSTLVSYTPDPTARYGTGIQAFGGCSDSAVRGCYFSEIYEAAITLQEQIGGVGFQNVIFEHNTIENSSVGFEIWSKQTGNPMNNIKLRYNTFKMMGYESRHFQHENAPPGGRKYFDQYLGVNLLLYDNSVSGLGIEICNNKFYLARNGHGYYETTNNNATPYPNSHDNDIFIYAGGKINSNPYTGSNRPANTYTIENAATFVADTGFEKNSRWYSVPISVNNIKDLTASQLVASGNFTAHINIDNTGVRKGLSLAHKAIKRLDLLTVSGSTVSRDPTTGSIVQPVTLLSSLTNGFNDAKSNLVVYRGDGSVSIPNEPFTNFNGSCQYFGDTTNTGIQIASYASGKGQYMRIYWYGTWRAWDKMQLASNLATDFTTLNDTLYPSTNAVANYVASQTVGLWDDRGAYNPTTTSAYPTAGGSGASGAILKGDIWTFSTSGTVNSIAVQSGGTVRALVDTPGQTNGNWAIMGPNLGYTPVDSANVSASGSANKIVQRDGNGGIAYRSAIALTSLTNGCNDATSPNVFYQGAGSGAGVIPNEPYPNFNGMLFVSGLSGGGLEQTACDSIGTTFYRRVCWFGSWHAWVKLVTNPNPAPISITAAGTTVAGSTNGSAIFYVPFMGTAYKKIVIYLLSLNGTASFTFPNSFNIFPVIVNTNSLASSIVTSLTSTAVTVTGSGTTGVIILEGY